MTLIWLLVILVWTVVSGTFLQAHGTLANVDSGFHIFVLRVFILLLLPFLPRVADFAHILVDNVPLHAVIFPLPRMATRLALLAVTREAGFFPARPLDILAGNSRSHRKSLWISSIFYHKRKFRAVINLQ